MSNAVTPDFEPLVLGLEALSRAHLLYFRIQTGRLVATTLYGGDIATMRAALTARDGLLRAFASANAERLDDIGLTENLLRQSLAAWAVVQLLPAPVVDRLGFSHVVELAGVGDDETRRLLAEAAAENRWSRRQLHDAVLSVRAGGWPDAAPDQPGLQPEAPPEEAPVVLAPGRVVSRFEKSADALDELADHWASVTPAELAPTQRERVKVAVRRLRLRLEAIEARLA